MRALLFIMEIEECLGFISFHVDYVIMKNELEVGMHFTRQNTVIEPKVVVRENFQTFCHEIN